MNFVFLNQYYPPDAAPTGIMLARVVQEMTKAGHEVTVICAKGGYASRDANDQEDGEAEELEEVEEQVEHGIEAFRTLRSIRDRTLRRQQAPRWVVSRLRSAEWLR